MAVSRKSLLGLAALILAVSAANHWWASRHDARLGAKLAALAQPGDIRMVSSETCAPCRVARLWLSEHRVPFGECLIERDASCRATYDKHGAPGTPLMIVRGQPQLGFSAERLRAALQPKS